ncbi:glycosyltransferase family 2 protein [Flavobacterium sp. GT3P67]|uniref:glycosyltransferase family 2 protein n=1 Tax=Flavobacterium sp. GT3P67 TaxID=2541722 RepID=UPI00104F55A3|nr:glycosyltransferase family A protein [Flavobacterium sp. GT3P67]TDE53927.1 glycosyltransferase family 2 protein [Flavobacterium sp. GT3P67]
MIIVYHINTKITAVVALDNQKIEFDYQGTIAGGLQQIAKEFPEKKILWCHSAVKERLNLEAIKMLFHHDKMMLSFSSSQHNFFDRKIGYVDESLFINVNKEVSYPTWQMSSIAGVIHASVLNALKDKIVCDANFDYYLSSIAKIGMPLGLLCYSEPRLLKSGELKSRSKAGIYTLFRFVKQHYKKRWVFLLLLNFMLYERKFPVLPFLFSFFYKYRSNTNINLDNIKVESSLNVIDKGTVDVIIPTIGRKDYLFDVLKDFSKQTLLPKKIIVVEQNAQQGSVTELDYILNGKWPFVIKHIFIHQAGVCNARNLALNYAESEWVFLADDDNRFEPNLIQDVLQNIKQYGNEAMTTSYPQKNESKKYRKVIQWPTFGAGNSFVKRNLLNGVRFNTALEFGYGEDADFGMQIRNQSHDVLYFPEPEILHLKAPIGGFRTKPILLWQKDPIQPKPSPTVMLYIILHNSKEQFRGYKTTLFFKFYKHQNIKNPYSYFKMFQKQWGQSIFWANQLKKAS